LVFHASEFLVFFVATFTLFWLVGRVRWQNLLLLIASYLFYGWVHPWFCILVAVSTIVDFAASHGIVRYRKHARALLILSLVANLGLLGVYKYLDFFITSARDASVLLGLPISLQTLGILLPAGISFYTFQTMSYTIDVYRGQLSPPRNFIDFALFVTYFPQLVAGPIERAAHLLPQIQNKKIWHAHYIPEALFLIIRGYAYKLIVADNVAPMADKIFMMDTPPLAFLAVGAFLFSVQIFADFAAYSDIARGVSQLFGISLMVNFRQPYRAISPSDFWRRWHISFSSWIRDYLYIPLGGSRRQGAIAGAAILLATMGLSGLWHGASWNFVFWGLFHGLLLIIYRQLGLTGAWTPRTAGGTAIAWLAMYSFTLFGWLLFRTPDIAWLGRALSAGIVAIDSQQTITLVTLLMLAFAYCSTFLAFYLVEKLTPAVSLGRACCLALLVHGIFLLHSDTLQDFIYFQF
jgi:alginate O-acetyltransferase complex protein AlgI